MLLGDELSDPKTGPKNFWTALKNVVNKNKYTNIPPIIENNIYISNFHLKANIFNDHFAMQCKIHDNGSALPNLVSKTNSPFPILLFHRHY